MADVVNDALDKILERMTVLTDRDEAQQALLAGLAEQLRTHAASPAKIKAIADAVETRIADINAAIVANTPEAPPVEVPSPEVVPPADVGTPTAPDGTVPPAA